MATRPTNETIRQLHDHVIRLDRPTRGRRGRLDAPLSTVAAQVAAIRSGDDRALADLVARTHEGDADAATVALWALYPLFCARLAGVPYAIRDAIEDDYLAIGYAVLRTVDPSAVPLGPKIVSRTVRRARRSFEREHGRSGVDVSFDQLVDARATDGRSGVPADAAAAFRGVARGRSDEVVDAVVARGQLADLGRAVHAAIDAGRLAADRWELLLDARVHGADHAVLADQHGLSRTTVRVIAHRTANQLRSVVA